jgi:RNA polymerase sigma-70 factor (ECF subfamily)
LTTFQQDLMGRLPRLRAVARAVAGDHAEADELVRLTAEAARARAELHPAEPLPDVWLVRFLTKAWMGRSHGHRLGPLQAGREAVAAGRSGAAQVRREVVRLPDDERLALALVLVGGLSYREAADVLELPLSALTGRLARARATLAAALDLQEDAA